VQKLKYICYSTTLRYRARLQYTRGVIFYYSMYDATSAKISSRRHFSSPVWSSKYCAISVLLYHTLGGWCKLLQPFLFSFSAQHPSFRILPIGAIHATAYLYVELSQVVMILNVVSGQAVYMLDTFELKDTINLCFCTAIRLLSAANFKVTHYGTMATWHKIVKWIIQHLRCYLSDRKETKQMQRIASSRVIFVIGRTQTRGNASSPTTFEPAALLNLGVHYPVPSADNNNNNIHVHHIKPV